MMSLKKAFRHFDLVSKFNVNSKLNLFCNKAYRNLNFMVTSYKFRKYACNDFRTQFRKITSLRYIKFGYNINVIRQTACMVTQSRLITLLPSLVAYRRVGPQAL